VRLIVTKLNQAGFQGHVAATRKTTPGFRYPEKYACLVGGADPHRMDLSSMVMLKDNHIAATGNVHQAVQTARQLGGFAVKIEVEAANLTEALEAGNAGADVVMLDNFSSKSIAEAAMTVKSKFPHIVVEVSGGIQMEHIHLYCGPRTDYFLFLSKSHTRCKAA
jgi:nicotinate-nucleotide pyrophosphorylase (carboxylating)